MCISKHDIPSERLCHDKSHFVTFMSRYSFISEVISKIIQVKRRVLLLSVLKKKIKKNDALVALIS